MKRIVAICICVFALFIIITGCGSQEQQYISNIKTSDSEHTINFELNGNVLRLSGSFKSDLHKYLVVVFDKNNDGKNKVKVADCSFDAEFEIPDKKEILVELYAGKDEYGTFKSIILDYIKAEKVGKNWRFVKSPVYENNKTLFYKSKNSADYLGATEDIQCEDADIKQLAESITAGISDDYEKVRAIHDWVAANIYYDYDALSSGYYGEMDAKNVMLTKKGVCEGYANILAALVRSLNIPCKVQGGYALGISTEKEWSSSNISESEGNHAWNEVYVDGRWIIIDATWDSQNQYKDGRYVNGSFVTDIYFDANLEFFSLSHKLIDDTAGI